MTEELIISVSGMRGIVGENLTATIAVEYGCAFGGFLQRRAEVTGRRPTVCVGRDSRASGPMVASAVMAGLCGAGVETIDLGLVTTPGVGIMLRELGCDGGVIITASHNPIPYNGIKLLLDNGMAPPPETAAQIRQCYFDKRFAWVPSSQCGKVAVNSEADRIHVERVLAVVQAQQIARRTYKTVLDSVNGAGAPVAKKLLAELGCEITAVNDEPTGLFAHDPEPTAANLGGLCEQVRSAQADVGFAQDPDADRLAIVDENGVYIGEEYTLALAAKYLYSTRCGAAAANLSTSRMINDVAQAAGGSVIRTPVGEAHVAKAMMENDCLIGGEGNGGVIDLRVGPIRDSLVAMALVLQLMAETGKRVSQLVREIGGYTMHKEKFSANVSEAGRIIDLAKEKFAEARINTSDGCRFDFDDGWLHLRISNTEPVMRIIVEADDEAAARRYLEAVAGIRASVMGRTGGDQ